MENGLVPYIFFLQKVDKTVVPTVVVSLCVTYSSFHFIYSLLFFDSRNFFKSIWEGEDAMDNRPVPYKTGQEVEEEELGGWRNLYEDVYENLVGEEKLLEKIEEQYEVMNIGERMNE